jgi:nucleotide-binding universal stress UspA family protein
MAYRCIVAATDGTAVARNAVEVAAQLAAASGASLRLLSVVPAPLTVTPAVLDRPGADVSQGQVETAVAVGMPGVEIARFAESVAADLIVMGRPIRSMASRRFLGDTGDAVARRSRSPTLFVPPGGKLPVQLLAALDGTERGMIVLHGAIAFALAAGCRLRAVTIEPVKDAASELLAVALPSGRGERLGQELDRLHRDSPELEAVWDRRIVHGAQAGLVVGHGEPVDEILREVAGSGAELLVLGFHRGGPPGVVEGKSVGRRLLHASRCALLTVPL